MLPSPLSCCIVDGEVIFLDIAADRYFMLAPSERERLLAATSLQPTTALPVTRDASRPGAVRIGPLSLAGTISRVVAVRRALRRGQLQTLIDTHRRRQSRFTGENSDLLSVALAQFTAARRYAPIASNCLTDSLALCGFLAARRHPSTLVLGVRLTPFRAHAWVQQEGALLNDDRERIAQFVPILTA